MNLNNSHHAVTNFVLREQMTSNITSLKNKQSTQSGVVFLVGAGPGDPDLLTVKALRLLQSSDVIVFDNLVSEQIRALFPPQAETVYVGKAKGAHSASQSEINQLLINKAKQGLTVCRLKGGDAFVFGRGGEEILALKEQDIKVEIVPGITAAAGCGSYAGIPLTHRGLAQGCTFVTAHAEKTLDIKWQALAKLDHTLVFYMGLSKATLIETQLINAGLDENTPVALIENGCCPEQRVITGSLKQLSALVDEQQVQSPALIMIGKVISLAEQLQWFNQQQSIASAVNELTQLSA